jgi:hypothetical protein
VPVLSDWHDAAIARHDNWKRELAEARPFAPELAARLLLDEASGLELRCDSTPLWAVATAGAQARMTTIPGAHLVELFNDVSLWRVAPEGAACGALQPATVRAAEASPPLD